MCNIPAAPQTTALTIFCRGQLPPTVQDRKLTIDECLKKRLEGMSGWVVIEGGRMRRSGDGQVWGGRLSFRISTVHGDDVELFWYMQSLSLLRPSSFP